jgi:hypothetical protein
MTPQQAEARLHPMEILVESHGISWNLMELRIRQISPNDAMGIEEKDPLTGIAPCMKRVRSLRIRNQHSSS